MNKTFNRLYNKLLPNSLDSTHHIHPCIYRGKSTFFYSKFLIINRPDLYKSLQRFASKHKISLKEDQRSNNHAITVERRTNWLSIPIMSLGILLGTQNTLLASELNTLSGVDSVNTLRIMPNADQLPKSHELKQSKNKSPGPSSSYNLNQKSINPKIARDIENILFSHFRNENAPDYVSGDLRLMADYYSQFPEAVKLIQSIANKPWSLQFEKNEWITQVTGTTFNIHSVKILFDTRAAAQLKLHSQCNNNPQCIASPADALLHELLHAQEVLLNSRNFLASGGMNTQLYPTSHEMDIIKSEKVLYKKMEKRDGRKRPQRSRHVGKIHQASCAICIM